MDAPRDFTTAMMSSRSRFKVSHYHFLIIAAFGAGEGAYFPGAVCRHDGRLVPVEDVATRLAPLSEGHDRTPLADYFATRHLYRHLASRKGPRLRL